MVITAARTPDDPPNAVTLMLSCSECGHGGFDDPAYYDAEDRQLLADPESPDFGKPQLDNAEPFHRRR